MGSSEKPKFITYKGRYIIVEPTANFKTFKIQRTIVTLIVLFNLIISLGMIIFLLINFKISIVNNYIIIPIVISITIELSVMFTLIKIFMHLFPQEIDTTSRTILSRTPLVKFKRDLSEVKSLYIEKPIATSIEFQSNKQTFLSVYGTTFDNKKILLCKIPQVNLENSVENIRRLCKTMGWKFRIESEEISDGV